MHPVGSEVFHADGQTDGCTDEQTDRQTDRNYESNSLFSRFYERVLKRSIALFHTFASSHFTLSYPQAAPPSSLHVTKLVNKYCSQLKNLVIPTDQNYMTICEK